MHSGVALTRVRTTVPKQTVSTRAILLRAVDHGDSDRIVTFLTQDYGLVSALARGARKSTKRFAGGLEPFSDVAIRYTTKKGQLEGGLFEGGLCTLTSATPKRFFSGLLGSVERMNAAGKATKWLNRFAQPGIDGSSMFRAGLRAYALMESTPFPNARGVLFVDQLLFLNGLALRLDSCVVSGKVPGYDEPTYVDPTRGGVISARYRGPHSVRLSASARGLLSKSRHDLSVDLDKHDETELVEVVSPLLSSVYERA